MNRRSSAAALLRAAHPGPSFAVTTVVALLAVAEGLPLSRGVFVTAAVLTGQLSIGWGNDYLDAARDRQVGRADKPLAGGEVGEATVRNLVVVALVACVVLSFLCGWRSALVHLGAGVAMGHLYNVRLKGTRWSWAPYAVAFGGLPLVVTLADEPYRGAPVWAILTAAALGVAAHFLNTLPDLAADEATGVSGLPHRLGALPSRGVAVVLLVLASLEAALGPAGVPQVLALVGLLVVAGLAVVAAVGRGRTPFRAAIVIALIDVALLALGAR